MDASPVVRAPATRAARRPPAARPLAGTTWTALAVAVLTALGVALRVIVARQALFADELSTYWIVTTHGLGGVISTVHTDAEITPPLYFVASWLTTQLGHAPELVRLPSLIAGAVSIPATYLLGVRTVGRPAGLLATAITALAPFMVYYSAEARGYGVMVAFVILSTLAMLVAVETRRARWWVAYGVFSCAAAYSHYTCVFPLAAQLLWLLWAHPEAARPALLANAGAVVAYLPWTTGLINDFTSPTSKILSSLSPFTPHDVRVAFEHWTIGYPYATLPLRRLPGTVALVLLGVAVVVALAGVGARALRSRGARLDRGLVLVIALAVSAPIGEAVASALSTNLLGTRNLAPSWPGFALLLAALLVAAGPRLRVLAAGLALACFAIAAVRVVEPAYQRPDFTGAAAFVDHRAAPRDVVVDETAELSPGPYSPMDLTLAGGRRVFRALAPQEHDHPFNLYDARVPVEQAVRRAVAAAHGGRVFFVSYLRSARFPPPYRVVASRTFPGFVAVRVQVYAPTR